MRHGWIREAKGLPSVAEQRAALEGARVEPERICRDDPPRGRGHPAKGRVPPFDYLLHVVRPRDVVVIANAACMAPTRADVLVRLAAIGGRCGLVFDCEAGQTILDHKKGDEARPLEAQVRAFADRADRLLARTRTATARRILAGAGGNAKMTDTKKRAVLPDWRNPELTAAQIAAKHGVSRRTLFAVMGKRFPNGSADHG